MLTIHMRIHSISRLRKTEGSIGDKEIYPNETPRNYKYLRYE